MEWVDGNLGSKVTIKYPAVYLLGRGARADILSVAFAGAGQSQDAGGKVIHIAPDTTSTITSKSISKDGGQATYRIARTTACHRWGTAGYVVPLGWDCQYGVITGAERPTPNSPSNSGG